MMTNAGLNLDKVRQAVLSKLGVNAESQKLHVDPIPTPAMNTAFLQAFEEAKSLGQRSVGTEHMLLGLIHDRDCPAAKALSRMGVDLDKLRNELLSLLRG